MVRYDKMYYVAFNAITDAVKIVRELPQSQEKEKLLYILEDAQRESENVYLMSVDTELTLLPWCS